MKKLRRFLIENAVFFENQQTRRCSTDFVHTPTSSSGTWHTHMRDTTNATTAGSTTTPAKTKRTCGPPAKLQDVGESGAAAGFGLAQHQVNMTRQPLSLAGGDGSGTRVLPGQLAPLTLDSGQEEGPASPRADHRNTTPLQEVRNDPQNIPTAAPDHPSSSGSHGAETLEEE